MRGSTAAVGQRWQGGGGGRGRNNNHNGGSRRGWQGGGRGGGGRNSNSNNGNWHSRGGRARDNGSSHPNNNNAAPTTSGGGIDNNDAAPPDTEPALRVLSFYEQGSRISFACYSEDENEIIFEDAAAHSGVDTERIVKGVLLETRPNLILVGNKVVGNAPLLECLTSMPLGDSAEGDGGGGRRTRDGNNNAAAGGGGNANGEGGEGDQQVSSDEQGTAQSQSGARTDASRRTIPYQLLKSSAFEPRQCRSVILNKLRVMTLMRRQATADNFAHAQNFTNATAGYHQTSTQPPSNFHSLAAVIDFDSPTLLRALGALLVYLRNTAFRLEEGFTVTINNIRRCPASDAYLRLEESALRTLRIFATDHHPLLANNNVKGRSYQKSKEGFSLFTLLDRTRSKAGRERLRRWMTQPLRDADAIRRRHVGIDLFLSPECHPAASLLLERLGDVGSMDSILLRMQRCCAQPNDFLVLGRMLDAAYAIIATLGGELRERAYNLDRENGIDDGNGQSLQHQRMDTDAEQHQYPSVAYIDELLRRCHVPVTRDLRERMAKIIDEEVTAETKDHVVIHYGFHEELDRAKETFETLDGECFVLLCCARSDGSRPSPSSANCNSFPNLSSPR